MDSEKIAQLTHCMEKVSGMVQAIEVQGMAVLDLKDSCDAAILALRRHQWEAGKLLTAELTS